MPSTDDLLTGLLGSLAPRGAVEGLTAPDPLAAWAASGGMWLTGRRDGPPLAQANGAGAVAATLLQAIAAASPCGTAVPGVAVLGERAAIARLRRGGAMSAGGAARLLTAQDGYVALSLPRAEDVDLVPALVQADAVPEPWAAAATWAATTPSAEVVDRARLLGLAVAALDESHHGDAMPAVRSSPGGPRLGRDRPLVVDLSSLWAGPLCAHLLRQAGAEVVKVESAARPDGARRGPAAFFDLLHGGSRSVTVDFRSREGVQLLRTLVRDADVVVTSSRRRVWEALELDPVQAAEDGTVWVAITAHGQDDQADRIGFGDDVAVAAGLVGVDEHGPVFAGDALADPLTGLAAAAAALCALRSGCGHVLDVAMVRVARVAAAAALSAPVAVDGPDGWSFEHAGSRVLVAPPTPRSSSVAGPRLGADNHLLRGRA
jgi:hypothetical protein